MKKISILAVILSLGIAAFSASAFSAEKSQYKVEFKVPGYINTTMNPVVPVTIKIATPDGKPYSGRVHLCTSPGGIGKFDGSNNNSGDVDVDVVEGKITTKVAFDVYYPKPVELMVFKSPLSPIEKIGETEILLHHIDIGTYDFLPEQSRLAVPADGKTSPTLSIRIKDEAGNPVKGVRVRADHSVQTLESPNAQQTYMYAVTDEKGIAKFVYPPSTIVQLESTQATVPYKETEYTTLVASTVTLLYYGNEKPKMVSLKKSLERVEGAIYTWDSKTHTATVKGVGHYPGNTMTFKEGTQFVRDGALVEGIEAPIVRKGDDLLVPEAAGSQNWIY